MELNTTPPTEPSVLGEVGELMFWTLVSGVLATLSLLYVAGWIVSSSAQGIYLITAFWVPLTIARYLRIRSRLLGGSKSELIADVAEGLIGVVVLGALVVFLVMLYGAATADVLGIHSPVLLVGAGAAAVVLAFAAAVWAKRSGWRLIAEHDAPGAIINTGFLVLGFPLMLGLFGYVGAVTLLMLVELFAGNSERLRQLFSGNMLAGTALAAAVVLILSVALHAIRRLRAQPLHEPNYLQSLLTVGFGIIFLHISTMLLIWLIGRTPL